MFASRTPAGSALQQERNHLLDELQVERARLDYVFKQAPAFLAVLRGPEHTCELVNDADYQLVGHRDLAGRPVREALPRPPEHHQPMRGEPCWIGSCMPGGA